MGITKLGFQKSTWYLRLASLFCLELVVSEFVKDCGFSFDRNDEIFKSTPHTFSFYQGQGALHIR